MNAFDFPPEFRTKFIATNGTSIYVRTGGTGPAAVLLHGYGETHGGRPCTRPYRSGA